MWYRVQYLRGGGLGKFANITFKESNILIGREGEGALSPKLVSMARAELDGLYRQVEGYIVRFPTFHSTLEPWGQPAEADVVKRMITAGNRAHVGPMAAVAGAFADELLEKVGQSSGDMFVENGGDVALRCRKERSVLIYPGGQEFEAKVAISLPPGRWGIASSSGKWGHSLSLGEADMVTVVARDAATADACVTSVANRIVPGCDPEAVMEEFAWAAAIAVIWNKRIWYKGEARLNFL
jgi:ApbE superfamily uncharacterized protein (UPF0280 family)